MAESVDKVEKDGKLREEIDRTNAVFDKLLGKQLPAEYLWEDEQCVAVRHPSAEVCVQLLGRNIDGRPIQPEAPVHVLVISKKIITSLHNTSDEDEQVIGHLMRIAAKVAKKENLTNGFRIVLNEGEDTKTRTERLHVQLLGGRTFSWPPG
mmetsp:Transcript_34255/g.85945  ORF Transcript_34255/g.85945 Transcript_34255/m.85945 type:complete len:151 (+) Transcript_34255:38-490(+)